MDDNWRTKGRMVEFVTFSLTVAGAIAALALGAAAGSRRSYAEEES